MCGGQPRPPEPQFTPPPSPTPSQKAPEAKPDAAAATAEENKKKARKGGRSGTILTGGAGVREKEGNERKSLLGY